MKTLPRVLRFSGFIIAAVSTLFLVLSKFIVEQPSRVKLSMLGVIIALGLFILFIRYGKLWFKNKLSAIATARELGANGKTKPIFQVLLNMFYIFYPALIMVLFVYGAAVYQGTLWLDIIAMIGCIAIYFIFEFVALTIERYTKKKEQLQQLEKEKEDMADRVAKKITFEINRE